jgi:dTDP-4-dehydrorhamnose reductase
VNRRALLVGGSGRLGSAIRSGWTDYDVAAPARAELELEDATAMAAAIARVEPDVVVNCAAFHDVDRCEEFPDRALAINAIAVERTARACREAGIAFVTLGTDYVFDGRAGRPYAEDSAPHPLSAYGISKLAGELLLERLGPGSLVVRTCGLYGRPRNPAAGGAFVDHLIAQARAGERIRVVSDAIVSPTFAGDLADAIRALVEIKASGLYHAANAGAVSWYEFAVELLSQAGIESEVVPIRLADWKAAARRPAFSALDSGKLAAAGFAMPSWQRGIERYLQLFRLSGMPSSP